MRDISIFKRKDNLASSDENFTIYVLIDLRDYHEAQ